MAIALRGTPQSDGVAEGADVTLTFDVPPQAGDVIVVFGGYGIGASTAPSAPSGYTEIAVNDTGPSFGAWYKVANGSETDVVCDGGGNTDDVAAYCSYVFSGADDTPLDATTTTASGSGTAVTPADITTNTDGSWVVIMAGKDVRDTDITESAGYTNVVQATGNDVNDLSVFGQTKELSTAGAEDPGNISFWSGGDWFSITMALQIETAADDVVSETSKKKGRSSKRRGVERLRIILRDGEQLKIK